jgi:hypothetical protein
VPEVDQTFAEAVLATAIRITHHTWLVAHSDNERYKLHLRILTWLREIQVLFEQI